VKTTGTDDNGFIDIGKVICRRDGTDSA